MGKCLYNGIKLEEIPELTHPFAFIWTTGEEYVLEAVAEKPATYLEDDGQLWISFTYGDRYSNAYLAEDTWNIVTPSEGTATLPASMIVWTNFNLCKEDGTVVLAASEPVPVVEKFPIREWIGWLLAGLCSRPLPMGAREPVAYLYNGVRLPGLPEEWNPVTHPCAIIFNGGNLWGASYTPYFGIPDNSDNTNTYLVWENPVSVQIFNPSSGAYVLTRSLEQDKLTTASGGAGVLWTNTDILNKDGSLFLAASAPVPVYE